MNRTMRRSRTAVVVAGLLAAPQAFAQAPRVLTARVEFQHSLRDMIDVENESFRGVVTLRTASSGDAVLEWSGQAEYSSATIPPPGSSAGATTRSPRTEARTDRWIGTWRAVGAAIEVHFVRSEAFRPAIAVDVSWRCEPTRVAADGDTLDGFRCQSAQRQTLPSGASHHLPAYMQVPIVLAAPSARIVEAIVARSGADRHAEAMPAVFHRETRAVPRR